MKQIDQIPHTLLEEYIRTCLSMKNARALENYAVYEQLDLKRKEVHDKILKEIGLDRNNEHFNFELSLYLDECIDG